MNVAQPIFCDVCNIGVSSEVSMRDHVKGRRHQQTLGAMERRKAMARNSLYCHGFPPAIPVDELRAYFQHFGQVSRIMVETKKGCYCIVHYESDVPVQMALNQRHHQLHSYSLTVRPRKPITTQRRAAESERSQHKGRDCGGEEEDQGDPSHDQLMNSLLQADSVLSQMEILYEAVRLSDADLDRRKKVCEYLQAILCPFFPTCTIHQFGSSVNGFGMRGCDMDIFLDLHDTEVSLQWEQTLRQKLKPVNLPYFRELQVLKTTEGPLMPSQLRQLSLVHRVKLMSRILIQHAPQCADVVFVPSVRCPIVRFVHLPTGIKCDVSINNRLALRNTQLLRMCGEDRRVQLLVFAVRYWGRLKQVAGNTNCGPRLSNYCLSLLVLFFMAKSTRPPILPTIQTLTHLASRPSHLCVIDNWDCSLPDAVPLTTNTQPADELLHQFFQFYNQLSLPSSVILTRTGTVMPLNDFLVEKDHSSHLTDFKVKMMAVQDPFVLQHNIAQNVSKQVRDQLTQEIAYATVKTSTWSPPGNNNATTTFSDLPQSSSTSQHQPLWGLPYLFSSQDCSSTGVQVGDPGSPLSAWCEVTEGRKASSPHCSQWTFPVVLDLATLCPQVLQALRAKGDFRIVWYRRVRTLLVWALREVFLYLVTDEDGRMLEEGEDLDRSGGGEGKEEEQMCVEEEEDGGGGGVESSRDDDRTAESAGVGCADVHGRSASLPNTTEASKAQVSGKSSQLCPVENQQSTLSQRSEPSTSSQTSSSGAEEIVMAEVGQADCPASSILGGNPRAGGGAKLTLKKEGPGGLDPTTANKAGVGEEGRAMQSPPHTEQECSMPSPSEASPMSELSHPSPRACEGKGSPAEGACLQTPVTSRCSQALESCQPCLQAGPSSETSHAQDVSQESSGCCEVDMVPDSAAAAAAATPALSHMDSPAVCGHSRDLPSACSSKGAAASVLPLRVEFISVGETSLQVKAKGGGEAGGSSSSQTATQSAGLSNSKAEPAECRARAQPTAKSSPAQPKDQKCQAFRVYCEGQHRAWYGRKVTRTTLIAEGYKDNLQLEKVISRRIVEQNANPVSQTVKFYCTLSPVAKADRTEAEVTFEPAEALPKEFSVFPTFFKSYFTKLVSKQLLESSVI